MCYYDSIEKETKNKASGIRWVLCSTHTKQTRMRGGGRAEGTQPEPS